MLVDEDKPVELILERTFALAKLDRDEVVSLLAGGAPNDEWRFDATITSREKKDS